MKNRLIQSLVEGKEAGIGTESEEDGEMERNLGEKIEEILRER